MKVYVHLKSRFDVNEWGKQFTEGLVPDKTPYGFHHAENLACEITYSLPTKTSFTQRVLNKLMGFDLVHVWRNREKVAAADIVWTMTESEYLGILFVGTLLPKKTRPKTIAQSIWLFDKWDQLSWPRKLFYKWLLHKATVFTVHSAPYVSLITRIVSGADVRLHHFGVSLDSFPLSPITDRKGDGPIRIFSAGTDRTRDWETLLRAFGSDKRFEMVVAAQLLNPDLTLVHSNLQLPRVLTVADFRHYYRWADFVVIPMVENLYSGITVALEATALGAAVISSETGGVPTYFERDEVVYVPPGNATALREAALTLDREARKSMIARAQDRFRREDYSTAALARRYVELSEQILDQEPPHSKSVETIKNSKRAVRG